MSPRDNADQSSQVLIPPADASDPASQVPAAQAAEPPDLEQAASDFLFRSKLIADADHTLFEEYDALCDGPGRPTDQAAPDYQQRLDDWLGSQPKYALCLSGGGIRSAAFCMGALRALARNKLLSQFHYLSMVSGGGYIGGWLLRLSALKGGVNEAETFLASDQTGPEVKNLRDFTNFLAPTPGLLSGDVWSGAILYIRNVLVNWMVFLPALMALALVPAVYRDAICAIASGAPLGWDAQSAFALIILAGGLLALGWGVFQACKSLPSHGHDLYPPANSAPATDIGLPAPKIFSKVILPTLIWAGALPLCIAFLSEPPEAILRPVFEDFAPNLARDYFTRPTLDPVWKLLVIPAAAALVMFAAFWIARFAVLAKFSGRQQSLHRQVFADNWWVWGLACLGSGAVIWAVLSAGMFARAEEIAAVGPLLVIIAHTLQTTFYVALRRGGTRADLDREWLARLNARLLLFGVLFAAGATCALILPYWLQWLLSSHTIVANISTIVGLASGPAAALMARQATSLLKQRNGLAASLGVRMFDIATVLSALLFAASLTILLSWSGQGMANGLADLLFERSGGTASPWWGAMVTTVVVIGGLSVIAWQLGHIINVNRFSMHTVYRNRLVRAFLGSSRPPTDRHPDSFVRFDPDDNPRLVSFAPLPRAATPVRLFPVIGTTLNLVGGTRTAWTERKAAPFTITPLRCGSAELEHRQIAAALKRLEQDSNQQDGNKKRQDFAARPVEGGWSEQRPSGAYAQTKTYAGAEFTSGGVNEAQTGLTLGTAMALSGAAISSSMGSRSSAAVSFLLTLFDLRLGMWLPNPACAMLNPAALAPPAKWHIWRTGKPEGTLLGRAAKAAETVEEELNKPMPGNTLRALFNEMRGNTNDQGQSIYLSDGGHFDNLGLYEMLRRRCRCILVIDVTSDPDYTFADLGTALRRASIDLDVRVEFQPVPRTGEPALPSHGHFAAITYPKRGDMPETKGELLVIKPWLPPDTPIEVLAYKTRNQAFPHDTTADQFFGESQFESYRRLGEHIMSGALGQDTDLVRFFKPAMA